MNHIQSKGHYTIYKHTGPTGLPYFGITGKLPEKRWKRFTDDFHTGEYAAERPGGPAGGAKQREGKLKADTGKRHTGQLGPREG